jgi:hypothetical protein
MAGLIDRELLLSSSPGDPGVEFVERVLDLTDCIEESIGRGSKSSG